MATGCTSTPAGRDTTPPAPAGAATTTSIVPVTIPGTLEPGGLASLGAVSRLPVVPLLPGHSEAVLPRPGTAAYRQVVQIAYRQLGAGPPLLLVNGQDASMAWWSPALLQTLAQHYQVTVFDLPGVGYSGPAPNDLSLSWLADATAGLASELGLSSPVVLGWGLGGQIAVAMTERHPALVADLVLADTGLPVPGASPPSSHLERLLAKPTVTPAALAMAMFPPSQAAARGSWLRGLAAQVPDNVAASAIESEASLEASVWASQALVAGLSSLRLPVLMISGDEDALFPPSGALALAESIPGAQRRSLPGGYAAIQADAAEVATVLQDFTG
jgi:3-oxoadipate enol-lactonase